MEAQSGMLTIKCSDCGCYRSILPKQVPKGDCKYCAKQFGWYFFPAQKQDKDGCLDNSEVPEILAQGLHEGDIITINTKIHVESNKRIQSVEREGVMIFHQ